MKGKAGYRLFYLTGLVLLMACVFVTFKQWHGWAGWLLMLFFFSLAFAFRGNQFLKGLSYTVMIIGVVSFAMYYPQYFKSIGTLKSQGLV